MRTHTRCTLRSSDQAGGGIAAGGSLIVALLFVTPELVCAQSLALQAALSNYNGYNISCFGKKTGAIDLTVTGGTPPYTYHWSTGATTQDLNTLTAGFFGVLIKDALGNEVRGDYTLTEPEPLDAERNVNVYPNGYNLSCNQCFNGSISIFPFGGVVPYNYVWKDGAITQHRYNLGAVQIDVNVTDANGCEWNSEIFTLTAPERSDWTMSGNAGTNPATQYLGTTDNTDVVFRSNGVERFRLLSNGDVKVKSLEFASGYDLLYADSTGVLKSGNAIQGPALAKPCPVPWPWKVCGNVVVEGQWIGSSNAASLRFKTNNTERLRIDADGKVGIGTIPPSSSIYRLFVEDGIATRDVQVRLATWPDFVFAEAYHLMPLNELRDFLKRNRHLPGVPSATELEAKGGVELGDMQRRLLQVVEEQHLYILQLHDRLEGMEQRVKVLEAAK